jgi:hypothetical protein
MRDLRIDFHRPPSPGGQARFGLTHLLTWVRARLRRWRLDADLARGADPCDSPALAYRAARLTSDRGRERLAASVEDIRAAAMRPARGFSVAIEPCRDQVEEAGPLLIEIEDLLRSSAPVYSQGVARLELLLKDGGGPLYTPAWRGTLSDELEMIIAALEGRDPTR